MLNSLSSALEDKTGHAKEKNTQIIREYLESYLSSKTFIEKTQEYISAHQNEMKNKVFVDKEHRKEINSKIEIRYISTVNISANADNEFDAGNSIKYNLLDVAIETEIRKIANKKHNKLLKEFKKQVDYFLKESGKSMSFEGKDIIFNGAKNKKLKLSFLSSGERQLVYILATAANTHGKPALFLMDEPEVSLHLSWQEKIIDAIMAINPQMQIIAVTHSPGIIMNGHMDSYVEMKDVIKRSDNV
ncbi:AAA family ATPase [Pantoea agglomerans]|uniref:AAA family ATPase n=1 Tax=Enterobacter agglomerans TaxID=549 RepID=UPI0030188649